jgi:tyrosine-specific transport protein
MGHKSLGATLLVAGTCIGAGMLGLPISTSIGGFFGSAAALFISWIFMSASALLMLEVSLWFPGETNLISMIQRTIGVKASYFAWFIYVFFLYALMAAYTTVAGKMIDESLLVPVGSVVLCLLFGLAIYLGSSWTDHINRWLMLGLFIFYCALVWNLVPHVSGEYLFCGQPLRLIRTGPLLITTFGFHHLIPSLKTYLNQDIKSLRRAILLGSFLSLAVYIIWQMLILGSLPLEGTGGLLSLLEGEMKEGKQSVLELSYLLSQKTQDSNIGLFFNGFSFCAILTSFIGVAFGLFDFFADGLSIQKTSIGRIQLVTLTFVPPLLISIFFPQFLKILQLAGIFATILLLLFPVLMVFYGRYLKKIPTEENYQVCGGKILLLLVMVFSVMIFGLSLF